MHDYMDEWSDARIRDAIAEAQKDFDWYAAVRVSVRRHNLRRIESLMPVPVDRQFAR